MGLTHQSITTPHRKQSQQQAARRVQRQPKHLFAFEQLEVLVHERGKGREAATHAHREKQPHIGMHDVSALEAGKLTPMSGKCEVNAETLSRYIPKDSPNMLPVKSSFSEDNITPGEKEAIIRMIYQLRQEVDYLKDAVAGNRAPLQLKALPHDTSGSGVGPHDIGGQDASEWQEPVEIKSSGHVPSEQHTVAQFKDTEFSKAAPDDQDGSDLSLQKAGADLIKKALEKYRGNRKLAAAELGISERTLYRKLKSME